ncbi:MAG: hypothetical protein FJW80_07500 [Actinobacteria bacterium]|nr:hypothetical protein [Actinomycetota bacterium]
MGELGIGIAGQVPQSRALSVDLSVVNERIRRLAAAQSDDIETRLAAEGIRHQKGRGRLLSAQRVSVSTDEGSVELPADVVRIATGSRSRLLPESPPDDERILTWQQLYDLAEVPPRLVVGSGVTGAEFASAYEALGSQVVLVSSRNHVLLAFGSVPNTEDLGLDAAGIATAERGLIQVHRVWHTSARGVYAAGDCTDIFPAASVAAMQGRTAMWHALGDAVQSLERVSVSSTVFATGDRNGRGDTGAGGRRRGARGLDHASPRDQCAGEDAGVAPRICQGLLPPDLADRDRGSHRRAAGGRAHSCAHARRRHQAHGRSTGVDLRGLSEPQRIDRRGGASAARQRRGPGFS